MAQYGRVDYWNERYTKEKDPFDWYQRYSGVRHLLSPSTLSPHQKSFPSKETARVLVPGCGNSMVMEEMMKDGYANISNVDFSPVVVSQMEERYKDRMVFKLADVTRSIPFPDSAFDLIFCKGTLDAILCGAGAAANARTFMEECSRVLDESHGVMLIVSHGSPDNRNVYLEDEKVWPGGVELHKVPKPRIDKPTANEKGSNDHFVYICRKRGKDDESNVPNLEDEGDS